MAAVESKLLLREHEKNPGFETNPAFGVLTPQFSTRSHSCPGRCWHTRAGLGLVSPQGSVRWHKCLETTPRAGIWELCLLLVPHQMDGHGFLLGAGITEGFPAGIIHLRALSAH